MIFEKEYIFRKVIGEAIYFGPEMGYMISGEYTPISYNKEKETMKYEKIEKILATRVSQFRKGIAIYTSTVHSHCGYCDVNAYLVDSNKNIIYFSQEQDLSDYGSPNLTRAFGGFYVSYKPKRCCLRTFPGQDRDTEYKIHAEIKNIITEDGKVLSREEQATFLMFHKILECEEIKDGVIKCEGKLYSLSSYLPL